jgi:hypothetical protein
MKELKMKISISPKTLLIIQASLVSSLIPMEIFSWYRLEFVFIPYLFFWTLSYSDLNKNKDD